MPTRYELSVLPLAKTCPQPRPPIADEACTRVPPPRADFALR
jgi:hypothetical protein